MSAEGEVMEMNKWLLTVLTIILLMPIAARADVSLIVLESVGYAGEMTGSGHTAIYFSNICADHALQLRLCRENESGVVLSSYPTFSDGSSYEWIAVPLNPYLFGVENEGDIPLYVNGEVRDFLREMYRRGHLQAAVPDNPDGTMPAGGWRTMLTATFNRDVYSLTVRTTPEEDARFLNTFNMKPNRSKFSSLTNNCADFARRVLNAYFPGSARRDWINDIGITTPKAVARSFSNYAKNHPERSFHITRYAQVAGTMMKSSDNRNFSEHAFKSRKYIIPTLVLEPALIGIFSTVYWVTGRFDLHKTYLEYASPGIARLNLERRLGNDPRIMYFADNGRRETIEAKLERERADLLGTKERWKDHKSTFGGFIKTAVASGLFQDTKEVKSFFKDLEYMSEPAFDRDGRLILKVNYYGEDRVVGATRENILSDTSDPELALKLIMARINADLNASEKNRSLYPDFRRDWKVMEHLLTEHSQVLNGIDTKRGRFLQGPSRTSLPKKAAKVMLKVIH